MSSGFLTWFSEESFRKFWKILSLEKSYIDTYLVRSGDQYRNLLKHISRLKKRQFQVLVRIIKALVFPVVMYGCEIWTIKKAECRRIDGFELWCWRRLLRVPWTARRSKQSFLKEISPEYSLEGLMLKLKPQYFGHLMRRADSFEKVLMLGMTEGWRRRDDRGWDGWMASPTRWAWVWVSSRSWWWTGRADVLQSMGSQSQTRLRDCTGTGTVEQLAFWGVWN